MPYVSSISAAWCDGWLARPPLCSIATGRFPELSSRFNHVLDALLSFNLHVLCMPMSTTLYSCKSVAKFLCGMFLLQIAMSEHLKTLEVYNISTIPKLRLPLSVLFAASFDVHDAESLFQHLRSSLRKLPISVAPLAAKVHIVVIFINNAHAHTIVGIRSWLGFTWR